LRSWTGSPPDADRPARSGHERVWLITTSAKLVKAVRAATPTSRGYTFTISAGLALADGVSGASSTLMAAADAAMYRAKADGGDRYVVAESGPPSTAS
jgi:GGDEF domain-containing protein